MIYFAYKRINTVHRIFFVGENILGDQEIRCESVATAIAVIEVFHQSEC